MPLYLGRTVATAEARIVDGEDRLVAHTSLDGLTPMAILVNNIHGNHN